MLTISAIKADVGGVGGHTRPSQGMMGAARERLEEAVAEGRLLDYDLTHTGDDMCLLMTHRHGSDAAEVHDFAWGVFETATEVAQEEGLYGAGQDLLVDAPSGNVRGAGPGAARRRTGRAAHRPSAWSVGVVRRLPGARVRRHGARPLAGVRREPRLLPRARHAPR